MCPSSARACTLSRSSQRSAAGQRLGGPLVGQLEQPFGLKRDEEGDSTWVLDSFGEVSVPSQLRDTTR
ncbi:MAG: hypothetical protein DIU79_15465 [Actinobacteria bacterium]|nr:MAG: hypothetical protein DIU79_15465 [Actinomycetota bacterium]